LRRLGEISVMEIGSIIDILRTFPETAALKP
jgi:hypothetical protein